MRFLLFLVFVTTYLISFTQELNCQISVAVKPGLDITTTEKEIFNELEKTIFELMNETAWTKDVFEFEERINCVMQLSIVDVTSPGNYKANLQVQVTRPVYNTTYNSTLFNFMDKNVDFRFERNAILVYAPNEFRDNLTSIFAYYAYMILGYDYDSFSLEGGTRFFSKAQEIVTLAQNGGGSGWRSSERGQTNRYWLVDNALQQLFKPLRNCFYEYHRLGLDNMYENPEEARQNIFNALQQLADVHKARPGSINIMTFLQAKVSELTGVFKDAETRQKTELVNLLKRLDPANSSKYQEIL
jgi:hypothetical protein